MRDEISLKELQKAVGRRIEVIAFGLSFDGTLEKIDLNAGTIQIRDKEDYAVLEIERIESFRKVG